MNFKELTIAFSQKQENVFSILRRILFALRLSFRFRGRSPSFLLNGVKTTGLARPNYRRQNDAALFLMLVYSDLRQHCAMLKCRHVRPE